MKTALRTIDAQAKRIAELETLLISEQDRFRATQAEVERWKAVAAANAGYLEAIALDRRSLMAQVERLLAELARAQGHEEEP